MKRLFAFVLAICMLTTAFAGCGQQANTPTEPKADQASTNEVEKKDEKHINVNREGHKLCVMTFFYLSRIFFLA